MAMSTISSESSYENEIECKEIIIQRTLHPHTPPWRDCCIYKVPKRLRQVKKEAYTPMLISIGPLHRNIDDMEMLKNKYFLEFFHRSWKCPTGFKNIINEREESIRLFYPPEISLPGKEDFVEMILLDSIFIIELFLRTAERKEYEKDDYILSKPWLDEGIKHDLMLLENQLPFLILDELHHHIGRATSNRGSFLTLACTYFLPEEKKIPIEKEVKHFTDLLRYFYIPPNLKAGKIVEHLHSATRLDSAGLKFQVCEENQAERFLLDIQAKKPNPLEICPRFNCSWLLPCLPCLTLPHTRLVIPPFVISEETEQVFRNIMALEQCHYPFQAYICNYIGLLNFLIISTEDAKLLVDKNIIVHSFGSNQDVVEMVKKLTKEIVVKNSCYSQVARCLNAHYDHRRNKFIADWWYKNIVPLKTVYFRDIWRGTATIAGIIVLLITIANFLMPFFMKNRSPSL